MSEISEVIVSEIADFFAGFGGPGEPDIQNGEAQRLLTERVLSVLALRERAEPVGYIHPSTPFTFGKSSGAIFKDETRNYSKPVYEAPPAPVLPKIDRKAICNKAHWLCARSPGATFYNAAEYALDEVMELLAPPAPVVADDSLPYDPQIAEYEQMMEAEQAEADTTSQQFESLAGKAVVADENGNLPCPFCGGRCDPNGWMGSYDDGVPMCGPECEDCGATANSIEEWNRRSTALAGKAVGGSDGFECTPVADLYELLTKCGECYDYTTSAKVAAAWIKDGYSAREYVKLDRLQEAMTQGSPGEADGWIPCSERMPKERQEVIVMDVERNKVQSGIIYTGGFFVDFNEEYYEVENPSHWMPLPAAPGKEV
ncbi:DUF551 domain-containing protein [Cronobacter sakazakii]|nr:DUF551 domain-containing protein [Cronobacter sakazakii]EJJ0668141.1 DUF551 domain-containing protein [Cronobacter sakazakii]